MHEQPRVGLVLMRTWVGGCDSAERLRQRIDASATSILAALSKKFTVMGPWVVDSEESLAAFQKNAQAALPDLLLLAFQTWVDESLMVSLVQSARNMPLVLWSYLPFRRFPHPATVEDIQHSSGSVSVFSALGTLRNLGVPFLFTWGAVEDPRLMRDLEVAGRAALLRSALRGARIGVLPERASGLQARLASAERMQRDLGPCTEIIPMGSYSESCEAVTGEQVRQYEARLAANYQVEGVAETVMTASARSALALRAVARERGLDVLAINYGAGDLAQLPGDGALVRPRLYPEDGETIYLGQDDLGAAAASYILRHLTGSPTMLLEFWYWDEALNQIVGGHAGPQDPALGSSGQVIIRREIDFCVDEARLGAQFEMVARSGRVTLFQIRATPEGWQAAAVTGIALDTRPVVEGYAHALLRLDVPIATFFNQLLDRGASQHWVMAYGSVTHELEAFCQMVGISLLLLTA